jgi:hypothetical protein
MGSVSTRTEVDHLRLRYGDIVVGDITDAFVSDDTWYGDFRQTLTTPGDTTER